MRHREDVLRSTEPPLQRDGSRGVTAVNFL
jgi:hypothetical protein